LFAFITPYIIDKFNKNGPKNALFLFFSVLKSFGGLHFWQFYSEKDTACDFAYDAINYDYIKFVNEAF
jgi:hypothetical protein